LENQSVKSKFNVTGEIRRRQQQQSDAVATSDAGDGVKDAAAAAAAGGGTESGQPLYPPTPTTEASNLVLRLTTTSPSLATANHSREPRGQVV